VAVTSKTVSERWVRIFMDRRIEAKKRGMR
jgi:hypothetical protein